jgi:glycosyltransferase involved in cell wall biosynthesis
MRILFALAGLHRVDRGAEVAFISIATELAKSGEDVTLIGSGPGRPNKPYTYLSAPLVPRERFERFPRLPTLRSETAWEEATFVPGLLRQYRPDDYDVTLTCSYPFTSWALRRPAKRRPAHVFVTQNGNWPAISNDAEYRFFGCDGLICTNLSFFEQARFPAALIGNGVDLRQFGPAAPERERYGLPRTGPVILMASAMIASKHVDEAIEAVSLLHDATLIVAGDGPLRSALQTLADQKIPGRFRTVQLPAAEMPALYRCADVFLHLSRMESFGNVYVEAMATGIPVVAVDSPHTRWIYGEDAFLVPPNQPAEVAAQLTRALHAGPALRRRLLKRAQSFSWTEIAGKYREFLCEVSSQQSAKRR